MLSPALRSQAIQVIVSSHTSPPPPPGSPPLGCGFRLSPWPCVCPRLNNQRQSIVYPICCAGFLFALLLSLLSRAGEAHAEGPLELADQLRVGDGLPALVLAHHLRLLVDLLGGG